MVSSLEFLLSEQEICSSSQTQTQIPATNNVTIITALLVFDRADVIKRQKQMKRDAMIDGTNSGSGVYGDVNEEDPDSLVWKYVQGIFEPMTKYHRFRIPFHDLFPHSKTSRNPSSTRNNLLARTELETHDQDSSIDWKYHIVNQRIYTPVQFQTLLNALQAQPLNLSKPAWQIHVVHGMRDAMGSELVNVYVRVHHSLCAGVALLEVLLHDLVDEKDVAFANVPKVGRRAGGSQRALKMNSLALRNGNQQAKDKLPRKNFVKQLLSILFHQVKRAIWDIQCLTYAFLQNFFLIWIPDRHSIFKAARLIGTKSVLLGRTIPLHPIKQAACLYNATFNELLFAMIAGGIRRYMLDPSIHEHEQLIKNQDRCEGTLRSTTAFSMRPVSNSVSLDNDIALMFVPLPINEPILSSRIHKVSKTFSRLRHGHSAFMSLSAMNVLSMLPIRAVRRLAWNQCSKHPSLLVSSLPGPTHLVHMNKVPLKGVHYWAPQSGLTASAISIMTYNNTLWMGYNNDNAVTPRGDRLLEHIYDEIEQAVKNAAYKSL